jgi:hypothetical protein
VASTAMVIFAGLLVKRSPDNQKFKLMQIIRVWLRPGADTWSTVPDVT